MEKRTGNSMEKRTGNSMEKKTKVNTTTMLYNTVHNILNIEPHEAIYTKRSVKLYCKMIKQEFPYHLSSLPVYN
jgi:hypothetical protein